MCHATFTATTTCAESSINNIYVSLHSIRNAATAQRLMVTIYQASDNIGYHRNQTPGIVAAAVIENSYVNDVAEAARAQPICKVPATCIAWNIANPNLQGRHVHAVVRNSRNDVCDLRLLNNTTCIKVLMKFAAFCKSMLCDVSNYENNCILLATTCNS